MKIFCVSQSTVVRGGVGGGVCAMEDIYIDDMANCRWVREGNMPLDPSRFSDTNLEIMIWGAQTL